MWDSKLWARYCGYGDCAKGDFGCLGQVECQKVGIALHDVGVIRGPFGAIEARLAMTSRWHPM